LIAAASPHTYYPAGPTVEGRESLDPTPADSARPTATTATATTARRLLTIMTESTRERSLAQAVGEVQYGVEYASLNERFWSHLDTALNLVQVLFGAVALTGFLATNSQLAGIAGLVLAGVSALQLTLAPSKRSVAFRDARVQFHDLKARAWRMDLYSLDSALEALRKAAPQGLRSLARPAQEIVHEAYGAPSPFDRLGILERLAKLVA